MIQFTIVKYLSLIYIGLAQNVAPMVTIIMSYYMTGEKLKIIDIFIILITFIGVSLISYGFNSENLNFGDEVDEEVPLT